VNPISKHRNTLGSLVLLLFFLANAGFTTVVSNCTMGVHSCVCGMETCTPGCCKSLPGNAREPAVTSNDACHLTIVIGGLPEAPSIIEKTSAEVQARTPFATTPALSPGLDVPDVGCVTRNASAFTTVYTPSVEMYLLNATFLI